MHCDGCVSAQPDLGETISKQQAEINSAVSPGNSFPLLVFLLSPSVWLSHSLTTPQHLFFLFLDPRVISPSLFRNPFPPRTVPSLAILSSVFLWFIYRLFLPRVLPSPASHAQAGTPRCTLSMVALWKVNNSVSVPAATAASSSVWLRRVSAAITQFNLLPRASRLQVASFSPKTSLFFLYQKKQGMTAWCSEIEQSSSKKLILCPQKKGQSDVNHFLQPANDKKWCWVSHF